MNQAIQNDNYNPLYYIIESLIKFSSIITELFLSSEVIQINNGQINRKASMYYNNAHCATLLMKRDLFLYVLGNIILLPCFSLSLFEKWIIMYHLCLKVFQQTYLLCTDT